MTREKMSYITPDLSNISKKNVPNVPRPRGACFLSNIDYGVLDLREIVA